jgi:hypothetical protein
MKKLAITVFVGSLFFLISCSEKKEEAKSTSHEIITDELSAEDAALEAEMEKGLDEDIENLDSTSTNQ